MSYQPPVRDYSFLLQEVLSLGTYAHLPTFGDATPDVIGQIIDGAARFASDILAPLNAVGDKSGCIWNPDRSVSTPSGFTQAYAQLVEGEWLGLSFDPNYGGQGLPKVLALAYSEMASAANMAFSMYPGLTHGAAEAIHHAASDELKATYLPHMSTGAWSGTMNLTEPHCGTDLGLLRTKAVPEADGTYRISGQKIWISGGEQDLAENIVHLVLARIEGAPAGVKGISLFIVPKFIPTKEGKPGERNGVFCAGLEHKMGIHGNSTCVMVHENSVGWLVGEENSGLKHMFVMMNEARLGVGLQGIAQAEAAYQAARDFAKDRLQGRALTGPRNPDGPADPIIVHPDVRRMLMESRALIEGGRAFLFWTALHGDLAGVHPDEAVRTKASDYMGLMTPVLKGYLTDKGFKICSDAMQVHGGSGFTEHFPASQYLRDSRIAMIYEGTNGIQALDLVGRKLAANGGRAVMTFFAEIDGFLATHEEAGDLAPFCAGLTQAKALLQEATLWLMQNGLQNPDNAAAASTDYMHLFGITGLAYMWTLMAKSALAAQSNGSTDSFYATKLVVGHYFLERILPDAAAHLAKLKTGSSNLMSLPAEAF